MAEIQSHSGEDLLHGGGTNSCPSAPHTNGTTSHTTRSAHIKDQGKARECSAVGARMGLTRIINQISSFRVKTSKHEVPILFHEPHVETGFRALHQPWRYYFLSVFQLHNESMNVWTHILACFLMSAKLAHFSHQLDFLGDPYTWPLLSGMGCAIFLYLCSSFAHCLQSRSELAHYTVFMVDYAGIGIYGLGSLIVHLHYCSRENFFEAVNSWFVPLGSVVAFAICFSCTVAKVRYSRPYPFARKIWQMVPVATIYMLLISPIAHRFYVCSVYGEDCNESIPYHLRQIAWFIVSGIFFASDFPQKIKDGLCDYFCHSHQLFHIAIMICTLTQMDGVFIDFQSREHIVRSHPEPTWASAFGPVILVIFFELAFITAFHFRIKHRLLKQE